MTALTHTRSLQSTSSWNIEISPLTILTINVVSAALAILAGCAV